MQYNAETIAAAINEAAAAAQQFSQSEDGGTCNFDHPYISVPRMPEAVFLQIERAVSTPLSLEKGGWQGRRISVLVGDGQASRRTRMAEAACKSLQAEIGRASCRERV